MAMYRRRRRRRPSGVRGLFLALVTAGVVTVAWWTVYRGASESPDARMASSPQPPLMSDRPEIIPDGRPQDGVTEKGDTPASAGSGENKKPDEPHAASLLAAGKQALERGETVAARTYLSEALQKGLDEPQHSSVRAELTRLGTETIFSARVFDDDPLVSRHVVEPGETLGKIANQHNVSSDLLANVNGLRDKNLIRAGQTIKVIDGPFHAVVRKSTYTMDVFLQGTFVKQFPVGLGAEGSTPSGTWKVGTKLVNPTYYPPRGGNVVAADDPKNPLAEHWIGLVGVGGEAVGQQRYGIHGTIEPDSIGKSVSLGCIRMYNEDVAALYTYLVENDSTVTVVDR